MAVLSLFNLYMYVSVCVCLHSQAITKECVACVYLVILEVCVTENPSIHGYRWDCSMTVIFNLHIMIQCNKRQISVCP